MLPTACRQNVKIEKLNFMLLKNQLFMAIDELDNQSIEGIIV